MRPQPNQRSLVLLWVRSPESQIVAEKLHDEGGVLVRVLSDVVELCNSILECCACHFASLVRLCQYLVQEYRIVERKAKADGMRHSQAFRRNVMGFLVSRASTLRGLTLLFAISELCDVAVVVSLHLLVEDFSLATRGFRNQVRVQQLENGVANPLKFSLDLAAVLPRVLRLFVVALRLLLLLDAGDDAPSR